MLNEVFAKHKNAYVGQACIFLGCGPTIDEFYDEYDLIKFGCNEIIYKPYKVDFYFLGDPGDRARGYNSDPKRYDEYGPNIEKFYRKKQNNFLGMEPLKVASYYNVTDSLRMSNKKMRMDLENGIYARASISIEIMQFILHAGFKKIFLIGHDCDYSKGSFHNKKNIQGNKEMIQEWIRIKQFNDANYKAEIYCINPKALKIFEEKTLKDLDQWKKQAL